MIRIKTNLIYRLNINAKEIRLIDAFLISCYTAYLGKISRLFKVLKGYTIHIDLEKNEDEILMDFKANTRNEVRRGIKDGYTIKRIEDINLFVDFYNNFAKAKGLSKIERKHIEKYSNVLIYASVFNNEILTMHASIVDVDLKQVSLLYSASKRLDDNIDRKSIGISNRFLHYMEFIEFKKDGFYTYDFSGVCEDPDNREEYSIGIFKKGFGGELIERYTLYSYPMWWLLLIKKYC